MRKNVKGFASAALAATMVLSMGSMAALAADYTLTVNDSAVYENENRVYYAYKLMDVSIGGTEGHEAYTYTVNADYAAELKAVLGLEASATDDDVFEAISEMSNDSDELKAFANTFSTTVKTAATAEFQAATGAKLEQGYYLIIPSDFSSRGYVSTISLTKDDKIEVKGTVPTFTKEILHNEDTWGTVGDNAIGDDVQYRITVNIPKDAADYKDTYVLKIHDVCDDTLEFNKDVALDGYTEAQNWVSTTAADGCTFEITVPASVVKENAGETLTFTYSCELLSDAKIATEHNDNTAHMEFSGSPYVDWDVDGDGDVDEDDEQPTEETEKVTVYDYTFKFDGIKVNNDSELLEGAVFSLTAGSTPIKFTYNAENDTYYVADADADAENTVGTITTKASGAIKIVGLDDETVYTLTEVTAPAGYKAIAPYSFKITANTNYSATGDTLTSYAVNSEGANADVVVADNVATITDKSSAELPSTGGMGTTVFYVIGITLMVGAAVVLVAKKKSSVE